MQKKRNRAFAAAILVAWGMPAFSKEEAVAKKTVSEAEFKIAMGKLNGKPIAAPVTAGGVVCHKLGRVDYYIVTGVDSRTGGMFCHFH